MSKRPRKKRGPIRRFFGAMMRCIALLICMGIICGSVSAAVMSVYIFKSLEGEPDLKLEDITMANSSSVYAINSETGEYEKIRELHGDENRIEITKYSDIPQDMVDCLVAAEDHRYWEHNGVDWKRTIASTLTFFTQSSTQGGSTITQQVIKNLTGNNEFSPERKVKEIFQAIKLNKAYSKEEVLKVYLNYVFFGNNCYGIAAAADGYFNKTVDELNLGEIATIIAITNNPTYYNPRTEKGMEHNKERREYIFYQMRENGYITEEEEDYWNNYNVTLAPKKAETDTTLSEGWYIDQVLEDVTNDLVTEKGYTLSYAQTLLNNGGLNIYACVDEEIQAKMEAVYANNAGFPGVLNQEYPETAAITIAPNGQVLGIIGGNEKTTARGWNNATMSVRHPGSAIKPISAYLQAFESDLVTWSSLWDDNPIPDYFGEDEPGPKNYTNVYMGAMTIQYALQQSINTIPVKLVKTIGPERCYNFLQDKLGFENLSPNDIALSPMALGGMTYGVTLE
ncbi:MAG: transglycosylase domain-containing protein, partial [Oscillospiraceae bacterium]|nr:transglycosylase domain-containing protein [Oscillospiraceae bacterium]